MTRGMNQWMATTAAMMLGVAVLAGPAGADNLLLYDIDPGSGSAAIASGSFTFDQTTDTITSWDISVVDGSSTVTFQNGGLQSSSYTSVALAWQAQFTLGIDSDTFMELVFANPGLAAITAGPATVPLLARSREIVDGVPAAIDNPSCPSFQSRTFALILSAFALAGYTLRRRAVDLATAISV